MSSPDVNEGAITSVDGVDFYLGSSYLIKDEDASRLYSIFNALVEKVEDGLCLSRSFPHKVMDQYRVRKGTFVWMTSSTVGFDRCINPTNIGMLHTTVMDFLRQERTGVVSLEGVEYLISNNGFDPIVRLLHALNDKFTISDSIFLLTVDEHTMSPREVRILEKDFDESL